MYLKFKNSEFKISNWLVVAGLLVTDSIYANHCKKKTAAKMLEVQSQQKSEEKEES